MTTTYEAIATYTTTNQTTISFTSIPQTYTDLVIMFHTKTVNNAAAIVANFNSDTGANYNWFWMYGSETVKGTVKTGNDTKLRWGRGQTNSGQSASNELNIFNYSSSSVGKAVLARENNFDVVAMTSGVWQNSSAITRIDLTTNSGNFASGGTVTLYGIKAE
jgi:hypothetical protein